MYYSKSLGYEKIAVTAHISRTMPPIIVTEKKKKSVNTITYRTRSKINLKGKES